MSQWEIVEYDRLPGDQFIAHAINNSAPKGHYQGADLRFQMQDGHPVLVELTMQDEKARAGEYNRLAPETVRTLPLASLTAQVELAFNNDVPIDDSLPDYEALRAEWPKGDLSKVLPEVARLYNLAAANNDPRQQLIQDVFAVSKATAGRMISKAREHGYIRISGAVGRPKAKGTHNGTEETTDR